MSNYNFSNTLDGLNNIEANDINTDNIATDYLTVNINSSVPLITPSTTSSNQIASCAFVQNALISNLLNYALLNPITQTFTGINIFGTLQAATPNTSANSVRVATTAYVKSNLLNYGLLNPATPQTFTGSNNFPTQLITDNSTLCATTAYVKNQNYITASSLAGYALLNPPTTQIWGNALTPQDNWWYGNLFSYDTIASVNGFSVKSSPTSLSPSLTINNNGSISTSSTITAIGNISTSSNLSGANISTLGNVTANQIFIRDQANIAPSVITQTSNTLIIGAISNNASPQTTLTLSTRSTVDAYSVILSGNTSNLNLGTNSNTINIQSPNLNIASSSISLSGAGTCNINSNVSIALYNFDITNAARTQGLRIFNNGANNTITDFNGIGTSTRFNFYSIPSTGPPVNNLWIGNGNNAVLQGQAGKGIEMTNDSIVIQGITNFNNTTTPTITNIIDLTDNTQKIATTAFIKGQGYAQLAANQTFTGINTFALSGTEVLFNAGILFNDILLGPSSTIINQSDIKCSIANTHDLGSVTLQTRTSFGIPRDNVYALNGNQGGLRGNSGNTIDITGTQATIGGTSVPVITTQPSAPSNSNEIASTAWVTNKLSSELPLYALLTANQTFTGTQTCVAANNVLPIKIKTQLTGYTGYSGGSLITDSGAFNGINQPGDYSV